MTEMGFAKKLRVEFGKVLFDGFFNGLARGTRLLPKANPARHGVEVLKDIPYGDSGRRRHLLDVYRPKYSEGPLPVVLYIHGGGFRILSKDTHWLMGIIFARRRFVLFNINYRLAPKHPFPEGLEDVCRAYRWVVDNASRYGGDLEKQFVVSGESAGANLSTALTVATCYRRPEPFARDAYDVGVVPHACVPACGMFQTSDGGRFGRMMDLPWYISDRTEEVSRAYLSRAGNLAPETMDLADPVCMFERGETPDRPLPWFFVPVGTRDPLVDDTRRLDEALRRLGAHSEARYYPGGVHAFHALVWREQALQCWRDTFDFLSRERRSRSS